MPTAFLLRFCICSFVLLILVPDTQAQRRGRSRTVVTTEQITPPKQFTREDLIRSQSELSKLNYVETKLEVDSVEAVVSSPDEIKTIECRETNGINKTNIADSYPFITEDGLRLYFTSNREGGHGRFFISTRKSTADAFDEPRVLSHNLTDGYYAGTLTADELTLCMVMSGSMYISIRTDRNAEFPVPVKLEGATDNYHFGPSIAADGKEIFVTVTVDKKDLTRIYKRTGPYTVSKVMDLALPEGSEAGPGQLSKDGLSYYLSIETKTGEHLWRYTRKSVTEDFGNLTELPEQMKGLKNILQPTVSGNESVMLFVTSPSDVWDGDDILLVNSVKNRPDLPVLPAGVFASAGNTVRPVVKFNSPGPQLTDYSPAWHEEPADLSIAATGNSGKPAIRAKVSGLRIYPNPFTSIVNIQLSELPANGIFLTIYDESGKMIRQQKINNLRTAIPLERSLAGVYTYQLVDVKGSLVSSGILVKAK